MFQKREGKLVKKYTMNITINNLTNHVEINFNDLSQSNKFDFESSLIRKNSISDISLLSDNSGIIVYVNNKKLPILNIIMCSIDGVETNAELYTHLKTLLV